MAFEIFVEQGRKRSWTVALTDADGADVNIAAVDAVRFKVGRRNAAPDLDLDSDTHTSNLSYTADTNDVNVTLLAANTSGMTAGTYSAEIALVDASDSNAILSAELGTVHIIATLAGDVDNP